jgi:ferredoxin
MEGNGPSSGEPRELNLLLAGEDGVAVDAVAADIIGYRPGIIDSTRIAAERGIGVSDLGSVERVGTAAGFRAEDFELTSNTGLRMIPGFLVRLVKPLVWIRPEIDPAVCTGCRLCEKSCPVQVISFDGNVCEIDSDGCVNCMCCHELCPENAVEVRMSRLARIIA